MKFEAVAAVAVGVLVPVLETIRRGPGHWAFGFTTMFEDYVAGGLLLAAGLAAHWRKPSAPALLLTSWAYFTGLMSSSFWGHLEGTIRGVEGEPNNAVVLAFKLLLWGTAVAGVALSFGRCADRSANN